MHCRDFFATPELAALGFDTSHYNEDEAQAGPGLGLRCRFGSAGASIFHGEHWAQMQDGAKAGIAAGTLQAIEGPAIGSDTRWTVLGKMHSVNFLSTSKLYAANVSATDKAVVEKLAHALDTKMVAH